MGEAIPPGEDPLVTRVREALRTVIDPELGFNIVDLGLIYGIDNADGDITIVMTLTTPGCPAGSYIQQGVGERAASVEGVKRVDIHLVWMPPWSPDMMSDAAKQHLGFA